MAKRPPNTMTPEPVTAAAIELNSGKFGQRYWNAIPSAWAT